MRQQRGFNIIEVLVALVVLSVGMLGVAGLYVITLRTGAGSIYRTQAVTLAADMADRIRANQAATVAYASAAADRNCLTANCSAEQLAEDDLFSWQAQLAAALPGGAGAVNVNGAANPVAYAITVNWNEPGEAGALSYVLNVRM